MKITVTPIPAAAAVVLGDDSAGDLIVDPPPLPVQRRQVQSDDIIFADRASVKGIGNKRTGFSWTVSRTHASSDAAKAFAFTHADAVPINCSVAVLQGADTTNFSSAVISEVAVLELYGLASVVRYTIEGAVP